MHPVFNPAMAQTGDEFTDAEARRIEVDADYLLKQCIPFVASRREAVPEGSALKPLLNALFSDDYCNCALQNYQRNMPIKAFREKDEAELLAFAKRGAAACALNILQESIGEACPPMMAGIAKRSRKSVPANFVTDACSCMETVVKSMTANDLTQLETRNLLNMSEAKKDAAPHRDEPDSAVDQMQACLLRSGFVPPLRR